MPIVDPGEGLSVQVEGVDLLKLNISGDDFVPHARAEETVMNDAEVAACVEVARSRGLRPRAERRGGQDVRAAWHRDHLSRQLRGRGGARPAHTRGGARGSERELEVSIETIQKMRKRGIRVLPAGDYGFAWNPHGTYARDLMHFVDLCGFTPMETIAAATMHGGEIMGCPDELGLVRPGYYADLLLIDGDPLQDIKVFQDPAKILMVMKDGTLHKDPRATSPHTFRFRA